MKALRSFTVRAKLPPALAPLHELAMNLQWSWNGHTRNLFRWIDPATWEVTGHDPVRLLGMVGRDRLETLTTDRAFMTFLAEVHGDLRHDLEAPSWFRERTSALRSVAYFSPEFGIAEAVPQYSGGLGVLAGDHLKAASGLGVPLVGMGLFYRMGYFRQELNADGWQQERYPTLDPHAMAVRLVEGARVSVDLAGTELAAQVWRADVGRVRLYLLDADIDDNDAEHRAVTDRLYGGGTEHRLRQEILLGVGGVRALDAVGEETQVFHTNEGHAGFLGLERIRRLVKGSDMTLAEAIEAVRAATVFTTHTPVPAGIDRFPRDLMERYFRSWAEECGIGFDELMALGHVPDEPAHNPFNMAVMGLRLAGMSNGVSALHGAVSRRMFSALWPDLPPEEGPLTSITNGVHARTWVSADMDDLLSRHLVPAWDEADADMWQRIQNARDDEVWRVREQCRERLVGFVRRRLRQAALDRGVSESDVAWCDEVFDPRILTIGFARRFAAYKRATLLLSQPDRLRALLLSPDRPVQIVFAGKAHPADDVGKEMIRQIVQFSRDPAVRHRIAFVEDYDIAVGRTLVQGCDVWLNTPRRPQEACGTSGEKAALNGGLNCSILDGWWDEMFDGDNGWGVSSAETYDDLGRRDAVEAGSLFEILEHQVVPLFYERVEGVVPRRWVRRIKSSLVSLGPRVTASRMVRDYVERLYEPMAVRADAIGAAEHARARRLAAWKRRVLEVWGAVRVEAVESDSAVADLGTERRVAAVASLGALTPDDVAVQLIFGPVGPNDEITTPTVVTMDLVGPEAGAGAGAHRYACSFSAEQAGRYGFTVRVIPAHPDLATPLEMGRAAWA
ncbi:MAG TPA: alpha-glucan family phosphorylase [Acidimicrobiales bacterium]|nr:alpha-glucan family phosphorylase [Acidimicrobiales bacterium]